MHIRAAAPDELEAIRAFGEAVVPAHYEPLLGQAAAQAQFDDWWTVERLSQAIGDGRVVVAEERGAILGMAEWSSYEGVPTIWKLYVHPRRRGEGIGPRLIAAVSGSLPDDADRLRVETFAVNERASEFYRREGFRLVRSEDHADPTRRVLWFERPVRLGSVAGRHTSALPRLGR
jgi:ribosomal protein S18 acetylase RimI-like enzyme